MKMCLNMIVRNESARIARCLNAVAPYISSYAIVDTGSTDGTAGMIRGFFEERGIPGDVTQGVPFIDFSQARNAALAAARASKHKHDYLLLVDADMELVVENAAAFDNLTGSSYDIEQRAGSLHYLNRRMVKHDTTGLYVGATHEYLDIDSAGAVVGVHFIDHADGENRKDKFQRDIDLLMKDIAHNPKNGRSWFYLAQSYRDAGQNKAAANAYRARIAIGGWDEELWNSQLNLAHCLKNDGDEAGFVKEILVAYNMRPSRAESLYDLSYYYRQKGLNAAGAMVAQKGMTIPYSKDSLFVSDYAHRYGCREEFAICGFYTDDTREQAFKVCNGLMLDKSAPHHTREQAKSNAVHYLQPLIKHVSYYMATQIGFTPPDDYVPTNPSIVNRDGRLTVNVRCVNYTITETGRYMIRGTDGTANGENPIHTRNFLVDLAHDSSAGLTREINDGFPEKAEYDLVRGLEDLRLFSHDGQLWGNACVRENNHEGWCEQALVKIRDLGSSAAVDYIDYMLPEKRVHEKNWMPINNLRFQYRLGTVVDSHGVIVHHSEPALDTATLSGGSQLIPFNGSWLCVVHEARFLSGEPGGRRYYMHRFAQLDHNGRLLMLSLPFVFHATQIEFAAGLAWHPDGKRLLISYGVRDQEAWVCAVMASDVAHMLAKGST